MLNFVPINPAQEGEVSHQLERWHTHPEYAQLDFTEAVRRAQAIGEHRV